MADLFGRYCYIDTPWIAGKKTRYRILSSGIRSNSWCEVPVTGRTEPVTHFHTEELVFVVLDTLVSDDSIIRRFALKDIELIPADVRPVVRGRWEAMEPAFIGLSYGTCSACGRRLVMLDEIGINFCPSCGADMREDKP